MHPRSVEEQMKLLEKHVSTEYWGIYPGTKSLARFRDELLRNVILMEHKDGKGLIRVARRARAQIFHDHPELGRLFLMQVSRRYPGGWTKTPSLSPGGKPHKLWSVTETRATGETPIQSIRRGMREEFRAEKGFSIVVADSDIEQLTPNETYEEHESKHYPGIRTGNFDVSFLINFSARNFRYQYRANDHGVRITSEWIDARNAGFV